MQSNHLGGSIIADSSSFPKYGPTLVHHVNFEWCCLRTIEAPCFFVVYFTTQPVAWGVVLGVFEYDRGFKKKHLGALVLLFFANDAVTSDMPALAVILWGWFLYIAASEISPRIFLKANKRKLEAVLRERNGVS